MRAEDIHRAEGDQLASRLAAIVQSSADAIIGVTLDGVITSWNTGAQDVYGYTAEEMIGCYVLCVLLPDHLRELTSILDRARRGERVRHFETRRVRKDGTTIDVSMSVSPIMDASGRITGAANVTRDITERNRAVRSESELTSRLAAIVQSSTDAIIGKTLDGVITSWNAGAQDIYGYTAEEMIGRNIPSSSCLTGRTNLRKYSPGCGAASASVTSRPSESARTAPSAMCRVDLSDPWR